MTLASRRAAPEPATSGRPAVGHVDGLSEQEVLLDPLQVFTQSVRDGAGAEPVVVRRADGGTATLPVARWSGELTAGDQEMLDRCGGSVLDVGCGPGRLTAALHQAGRDVLGLDLHRGLPVLARAVGAPVHVGSVFGAVPGLGDWDSLLLADGNIGIGGDVARLLLRCRALVRPGGTVAIELGGPEARSGSIVVRLERAGRHSGWITWGVLGVPDLARVAAPAGLEVSESWRSDGRWFATLVRPA